MLNTNTLDTIRSAKRMALQEIDDIANSGCMTDCKIHNLDAAVHIVYHACQIEAMNMVGDAISTNYITKKTLTPGVKNTTLETVTSVPAGTTLIG